MSAAEQPTQPPHPEAPAPMRGETGGGGVTVLLNAIADGDSQAAADLLPLVYGELRRLAQSWLNHLPPGQTLEATALVHEAYLRLVGQDGASGRGGGQSSWDGRAHFFGAAAQSMRNILVDQARRKGSMKHGGGLVRSPLHENITQAESASPPSIAAMHEEVLAVDAAVDRLRAEHSRQGEVVMLHYFAGLPHHQIAEMLGVTTRTIDRDWRFAKAWLRNAVERSSKGERDRG